MPQMNPMNWLLIFSFMTMSFMLMTLMTNFSETHTFMSNNNSHFNNMKYKKTLKW